MDENQIEKIDLNKIDWRGSREFFESLGEALDRIDDKDEKYDFTWVGKRKAIIEAGAPINKTFRPDVEASKNWDTTENLFIEGDNLDALKLLQESYLGKVKMIYIDPPYNTGKDFVYHDNFKADVEEYDEATEYKDEAGNIQFKKNEKSNGRYHSDWLSMMYPRLKLARNLLTDDGAIFVSIDYHEHANLRKLLDEVFGEDNFQCDFVWLRKTSPKGVPPVNMAVNSQEHVLCYSRSDKFKFLGVPRSMDGFSNPDNDPRGIWRNTNIKSTVKDKSKAFTITDPSTSNTFTDAWAFSESSLSEMIEKGQIIFPRTPSGQVRAKEYYHEFKNSNTPLITFLDKYDGQTASDHLTRLMGGKYFQNPKNVQLIKTLVSYLTTGEDIVLDFFSGSGTTAEAVQRLSSEDETKRKWIMVQLPETTEENSDAYKAGFATIPEISRERIRRSGDKIASEHPEAKVDYGFRALTIADTNYKEVYRAAGELQQSALLDVVDNVKEDRSDIDLLYGVLTQSALELNRPIEKREIDGSDVYLYDHFGEVSGLIGCFSEQVSEETIKEIAKLKPLTAVFRDSSFSDSQAKVNLSEHFRVLSPETKVKVI
ncbi:hypothetical protein A2707_04055 [Candidatus Saccharibacteria bacterium RIFCSPHIGHO2_01_FULL_45_15]|nr:MAG: hypothetical protein A2707_04055 [Candidatus Saccharibacteria bacterium RIFCSPHIGHO2_01_FULL_45_15]OGL27118.1 MAG: hypothetical protein A3C39_00955 [Candidatus Saccharibacteria bacterium RIFCSPHIGHO2_02_FULL_46_12]OGL31553.1 MAG: hypothetical protein A3E76_02365 [Candidatus Saccharibacteria bacterium RIFCSPHIGHO2_12_FULL_44_22]